MELIKLKNGNSVKVDAELFSYLNKWKWHQDWRGYVVRRVKRKDRSRSVVFMHRVVANTPEGMCTDHINHDKLDNRSSNLRVCSYQENARNKPRRINNTTGYIGVHPTKRSSSYEAGIMHLGKQIYIGRFKTAVEAAKAYNKKALELHGDFASLNEV